MTLAKTKLLTGGAAQLNQWLFGPAPATRLALLRVLTGVYAVVYLVVRAPHLSSYGSFPSHAFHPVGVAALLPGQLSESAVVIWIACTIVLAMLFSLGVRHRILSPCFAISLLGLLSYANSFGNILHTDNLLTLHVGILAFSPAADRLALDARRAQQPGSTLPHGKYQWPVRLMCLAAVLGYALAGYAKLHLGGSAFLEGETLRNLIAYDSVRKHALGSIYSPFGSWLLPYASAFTVLAWLTLLLELGAPLALLHRRIAIGWAITMWGFHLGVLALMAIAFVYPLTVGLACFFPCERLLRWGLVRRLCRPVDPATLETAP